MSAGAHTDAARGPEDCWAKAPGLYPTENEPTVQKNDSTMQTPDPPVEHVTLSRAVSAWRLEGEVFTS